MTSLYSVYFVKVYPLGERFDPEVIADEMEKSPDLKVKIYTGTICAYNGKNVSDVKRNGLAYGKYKKRKPHGKAENPVRKPAEQGRAIHERPAEAELKIGK